jgi:cytochrome c oxidase assembly factor CtaG
VDLGFYDHAALIADQHVGGGVAWDAGELPTVAIAIMLAYLWQKDDRKETIRRDRKADQDGGAELAAYNSRLKRQSERMSAGPDPKGTPNDRASPQRPHRIHHVVSV